MSAIGHASGIAVPRTSDSGLKFVLWVIRMGPPLILLLLCLILCVNRSVRQPAAACVASRRRSRSKASRALWWRQLSLSTTTRCAAQTKSASRAST
jgi:hypothetical protein